MIGRLLNDVLIPKKVGSYYLVNQRILGFDIGKTSINVTQLLLHGNKVTLEKFIDQPLELEATTPYPERVAQTIRTILSRVDRYDAIRTSLASSVAIFKELTLPFTDPTKISMVINYEIEPFLPFPINQTIVDFIITQKNEAQKSSVILAAAVKKEYIAEHLSYFEQAGVSPSAVTVDLFDLYGLYKLIPTYKDAVGNYALIDIGFNTSRIAFIVDGKLTLVRTLPKGMLQWAKQVAQKINSNSNDALEKILRFGLNHNNDQQFNDALKEALTSFLSEIKFTLDSFAAQAKTDAKINKILLLGQGSEISNISEFFNQQLGITCTLFDVNELLKTEFITLKNENRIPQSSILSLSTALITPTVENFNLRKQEFTVTNSGLFYRQFFTTTFLLLLPFASLLIYSYLQLNGLKNALKNYESGIISTLNKQGLTTAKSLNDALKKSEEKVKQEETIWFAFSSQTRFSFLKYLQELTAAIDKEATGLDLKKLVITEEPRNIILDGEVRDYDALKVLEKELKRSNLFTSLPSLQAPKFTITLPLKTNGDTQ